MSHRRRLLMSLLATALGLGLIEGASWIAESVLWGAPYAHSRPAGLYYTADGRKQLVPGAHLRGALVDVAINSWGFRDDEIVEPVPDAALRVWVVGGSTTFDIYARDNASTWPALLQERLQAGLPTRRVDVLNAGIPGETLQGSLADFAKWGSRFQTDIVVLFHGPNDIRRALTDPEGVPQAVVRRPWGFLTVLASARLMMRLARPGPWPDSPPLDLARLTPVRGWLEQAIEASSRAGAHPVLATHPLRVVRDDSGALTPAMDELAQQLEIPRDQTVTAYDWYNAQVHELGEQKRLVVAPVAEGIGPAPENWGDLTHFRRPGAELAAQIVADAVLARPSLTRRRRPAR
jgi:lysophospholipase L1-like esterase